MKQFEFDQEKISLEISEINRKAAEAIERYPEHQDIDVAPTERTEEYSEDRFKLYRYKPLVTNPTHPVLLVYALVNKPYILDLEEERSFIRSLLKQGLDVYLIEWEPPQRKDRFTTMDDHVCGYINRSVRHLVRKLNVDKINLMGVCQGGVFSICYAALYPELVNTLTCMITPVDFDKENSRLSHLISNIDIDAVVDSYGNIPGDLLNWSFVGVNPVHFIQRKYLGYMDGIDDESKSDFFLRLEKWSYDSPDQSGETFRKFCKDLYQQNKLINKAFYLQEQLVDLARITMPVLNIYAKGDLIVPKESSQALGENIKTDNYKEIELKSGHIGFFVEPSEQQIIPAKISRWLDENSNS